MMKRYRILTPVPGHTEVIGTVGFSQGVAEVEAEQTAAPLMYFRAQGYTILEQDEDGEWVPEAPLPPRFKGVDPVAALQAENDALRAQLAELQTAAEPVKPARGGRRAAEKDKDPAPAPGPDDTEEPKS